jgi:hypothetical protein
MNRRLERLLLGLLALGLAGWLATTLLDRAEQAARRGNPELRRDALLMLWSPAVLAVAGAGFVLRALLLPGVAPSVPRHRQGLHHRRPPGAAAPTAAQGSQPDALPSPYLAACRELGLPPGAPWPVVRATWRRQLRAWHPDNGGDMQRWIRRQAAYQLLEAWESFGNLNRTR